MHYHHPTVLCSHCNYMQLLPENADLLEIEHRINLMKSHIFPAIMLLSEEDCQNLEGHIYIAQEAYVAQVLVLLSPQMRVHFLSLLDVQDVLPLSRSVHLKLLGRILHIRTTFFCCRNCCCF